MKCHSLLFKDSSVIRWSLISTYYTHVNNSTECKIGNQPVILAEFQTGIMLCSHILKQYYSTKGLCTIWISSSLWDLLLVLGFIIDLLLLLDKTSCPFNSFFSCTEWTGDGYTIFCSHVKVGSIVAIALWLWFAGQKPQSVSQATAEAEGITAVEIGLAAEVASRFAICIFVAVDEHTDHMYEALGMLALALNFHLSILLSTLGNFLPRQ